MPLLRTLTATRPMTISITEIPIATVRLPMKSNETGRTHRRIPSCAIHFCRSAMSKITREQKIAVNMHIKMPRIKVTANPRICSVPIA